jgi:lysophospholipase L1-like esterase
MSGSSLRATTAVGLLLTLGVACGASEPTGPPREIVVFLGDSLVFEGDWQEAFPDVGVVNLGVRGDTVMDVTARLDQLSELRVHVEKLFLLIGSNDARLKLPARDLAARYAFLVSRLRQRLPDTQIHLMTLPPVGTGRTEIVLTLNETIRETAASHQLVYIDLYPRFVDPDGLLRGEYTPDGLHLNDAGYEAWVTLVAPYVNGHARAQSDS